MIDPRISMGVTVPDLSKSVNLFQDNLNNIQNRKMNEQAMQQKSELFPMLKQQNEQKVELGQQKINANESALNTQRQNEILESINAFAPTIKPFLENGDSLGALNALQVRKQQLKLQGVDTTQTDEAIQEIINGNMDSVLQDINVAQEQYAMRNGQAQQSVSQREFDYLTELAQNEPNTVKGQSAQRKLGLVARAGAESAAERVATNENLGAAVARQKGAESMSAETGKLAAQLKLSPKIKSAVELAISNAKAVALDKTAAKSNQKAMDVYQAGINGLSSALDDAETGVLSGTMYALSDNNKIASGAVAAMAPILKQMFRSAGEGNFTDSDQKLLLDMIPTTSDSKPVRKAKLRNIDNIVKAKLGINEQPAQQQAPVQQAPVQQAPALKPFEQLTDNDLENMTLEELEQYEGGF